MGLMEMLKADLRDLTAVSKVDEMAVPKVDKMAVPKVDEMAEMKEMKASGQASGQPLVVAPQLLCTSKKKCLKISIRLKQQIVLLNGP